MFIAVVSKGSKKPFSGRSDGSWTSYMSGSKAGAIELALSANERFDGKYTVLVGELTEVVRPRRDYYLRSL